MTATTTTAPDLQVVVTVNPATGTPLAEYASFTAAQVEDALTPASDESSRITGTNIVVDGGGPALG